LGYKGVNGIKGIVPSCSGAAELKWAAAKDKNTTNGA